ncbi:MAG: hypothetical protein F6K31_05080 [Symploca sp. SIO2G7]|nr:hypothetical protein [Symploca sp. SIO2G7]
MFWINFLLSILASIIASTIMLVVASFLSSKFRWILITILNALVRGDIETIFPNARRAQDALMADISKSKRVWIFAARGGELSRETFSPLFKRTKQYPVELRVLLPITNIPAGQYDWIELRSREIEQFDPGSGNVLRTQIDANAMTIAARQPHGDTKIRRYNAPQIGRIILTDRYAYFTPYQPDSYGKNSAMYQFRYGGPFYRSLLRFFAQVWESSKEVEYP